MRERTFVPTYAYHSSIVAAGPANRSLRKRTRKGAATKLFASAHSTGEREAGRGGFSLIEMMVVLILIGLSMFLATPLLSGLSKTVELKGTAKKISAILRYCRSEAVNQGKVYQALFDLDQKQVYVQSIEEKEENEAATDEAKDESKDGIKDQTKDEPGQKTYILPKGVEIKEVKSNSPEYPSDYAVIEFYPNGGSNGGTILLDSSDRKGYRIKVNFLTGIVEIEKA